MNLNDFATVQLTGPHGLGQGTLLPELEQHVGGKWVKASKYYDLVSPITGKPLLRHPKGVAANDGFRPFVEGLKSCPEHGLHNPLKNPERLVMLGEVFFKAAMALDNETIANFFTRLIMRVMPKSYVQAKGEVTVTCQALKNFSGDGCRFVLQGRTTPGDRPGQESCDYWWPFGSVIIIAPFNFPLEIPVLQLVGALIAGNRPLVKAASTVSVVIEQFLRLLFACGLPESDVDLIHCSGSELENFISQNSSLIRHLQFTGSSGIAKRLTLLMEGRIGIEDAGFDWKLLGPDFLPENLEWVAWQCDQDAYAASGQKCSAQSFLAVHENWWEQLIPRLKQLAGQRKLDNLTNGPVLTWTTEAMLEHIEALYKLPGAEVLFGGQAIENPDIPSKYGFIQPTAVFVPLNVILSNIELVTTEVFGPVQVVTRWNGEEELQTVLQIFDRTKERLTAAIVSNDPVFVRRIEACTVNGTTYSGMLARTTGAPQNTWFGPAGSHLAAGIGTKEAILWTWTSPRCIIRDTGPTATTIPAQS